MYHFNQGFEANRNKSNFEKDVDNLLFGDMRPPPRRRNQGGDEKPAEQPKKPTPAETKKPAPPPV